MSASSKFEFPVDAIYHGDSRDMRHIPSGVVSLVVCSPPYNVRKPYTNHNDDMPLPEYRKLLLGVWRECKRVLRPGGRLCVNVAGVWRQPYLPLHAIIWQQLVGQLKFRMRGEIIWDKGASVGVSTAWGSWQSPSNPTLRDVHEQVLIAERGDAPASATHDVVSVFSRDGFKLENQSGHKPDIDSRSFADWTRSVWRMTTESSGRVGHPAPFPVELPKRLILLYTYPGDIVLDPFAGSGSTCVAAVEANRHYIGYDVDADYVEIARERVRRAKAEAGRLPLPGIKKAKQICRMTTTTLVAGRGTRDREVRVSIQGEGVVLGIKSLGNPDPQKQHVTASLTPAEARRLADALVQSVEELAPKPEASPEGVRPIILGGEEGGRAVSPS